MKTGSGSRPRYVYYNFRSEIDSSWTHNPDGTAISAINGTGYVTLDLLSGDETIAAYHSADAIPAHPTVGIDAFRGFGIFTEFNLNSQDDFFHPHIARNVDSGRLHMITTSLAGAYALQYTYSSDDGATWSDYTWVDTIDIIGYIIVASPVTDKTAILYCKKNGNEEIFDVFYNEAADGISWDFRFPINITEFAANDSLSTWTDIDAVYDYNDNLHIVYQAAIVQGGDISLNNTQLRHWSENTGHNIITTGPDSGCARVGDCLCVAQPNIGVAPYNNALYTVWSEMNYDDVSAGGYSNGELYASSSDNYGVWWLPKVNITNSPTPGCAPMNCDCEVWVSLAEKVDGTLHVLYIDDNDAGVGGQGVWTTNPVMYLEVDVGDLVPVSADESGLVIPTGFEILHTYPNPFNARTTIEFALGEPGDAELTIYDITGAKTETIRRPGLEVGRHSIVWDAEDMASGVYFARLESGGESKSVKMVLLK
jgi:hypothetical protein